MTRITARFRREFQGWIGLTAFAAVLSLVSSIDDVRAQSANSSAAPAAGSQASQATPISATDSAQARAHRRAVRRRQRLAQQQHSTQQQQGASAQVGLTSAQRTRDAQILAAQKKQSDAIANENDTLTQKYIEDQQKVEQEPRIQDAPGPDSTPPAGAPAIMPAQSAEPPRIQDAPGPAQTLPKAPASPEQAPAAAPAPAPRQ